VSKKNNVDEGANDKKNKKMKRKNLEKIEEAINQSEQITHQLDMYHRFDRLNLVPPTSIEDLDRSIGEIRDKIEILNKPSEEEIAAYKERAGK